MKSRIEESVIFLNFEYTIWPMPFLCCDIVKINFEYIKIR